MPSVHDRKKLENEFKCTICNKKSCTEEHTLKKHIKNVHKVKNKNKLLNVLFVYYKGYI